jgi:hypothetical protein
LGDGRIQIDIDVARQRAEHPDYEPDLNFKKAKAETGAEQQPLI